MCGISGIYSFGEQKVTSKDLEEMMQLLVHRGPDDEGFWLSEDYNLGLGHNRLSIIDLSERGKQPMMYLDRYVISFNGEIYNYPELRAELESKGYEFISDSDTEVLLASYAEYGSACLDKLDGMFAFAIFDGRTGELFCARDRFGEKPFFYRQEKDTFTFASEIKAIARGKRIEVNEELIYYYLQYDVVSIPDQPEKTFYKNIYALPAAHYMTIDKKGKINVCQYWSLSQQSKSISEEDAKNAFETLFFKSVKRRLRSDVEVGSSLSGGLDSSSVVAAINQYRKHGQHTFSARFKDSKFDEGTHIQKVTDFFKTNSHEVYLNVEQLSEQFEKIFYHQEEPYGSASIYAQWEVMQLAKKSEVKVLLDGQGGDEVFAGYPKYYQTYFLHLFKNDRKKFATEVEAYNKLHGTELKFGLSFALRAYMPKTINFLGKLKRNIFNRGNTVGLSKTFYRKYASQNSPFKHFNNLNAELHHSTVVYGLNKLLRFADRNSMAFSREIRLPFLSHELVEWAFGCSDDYKLRDGWTKYIIRKGMEAYLPREINWRKDKMGYAPPQDAWMKSERMQKRIEEAKKFSMLKGFTNENSKITDWQYLMVHQTYKFSEGK